MLDRLANSVVRHHPGFAQLLEHAVYGDALDRLQAEIESDRRKLAETWHHGEQSTAA
jgi:hypothetical protein